MEVNTLDYEAIFLQALKELLPSLTRYTDKQLVSKAGKEKFEEGVCQMVDFVVRSCGSDLNKNECYAIFMQVFKCLVDYMSKTLQIPVTLHTVINNTHLMPFATNMAFPGYADSGLLKTIVAPRSLTAIALKRAS